MKKSLVVSCVAVALALAAALLLKICVFADFNGVKAVRVNIPRYCDNAGVDSCLRAELGNDFGGKVSRLFRISGADPGKANGSYVVEPGMTALRVAQNLRKKRQTPVRFTFNNIRTLSQLAERAGMVMEFTPDEFLEACDSVLQKRGYRSGDEYTAAFLPDSYEFYWTASPYKVVSALADTRDRFWNEQRRSAARRLGLRPVEVAVVASIVEEETADDKERGTVARLYLNRLQKGMKLQADPTVKFAVGDFSLRRITGRHLQVRSPYNTYLNEGLPPGPIRIAESATLKAVLDAPQHDYIYMCAKEDFSGRHNFAVDYATHSANARRYRNALDRRGIK